MKSIRLTTPSQHEDQNHTVELDSGNLERWLKSLPGSDVFDIVDRLDEAVSDLNEVKVDPSDRMKLLEVYFAAFHSILQGYDEMRIAQLKVSTKQKQKLANDIMWLYIKLSHGYKIIVKEHVGESNSGKQPSYMLLTVFRAMELTVISLIYSFRFGLSAPPLTFIELHQLYAFAEYSQLTGKAVKAASGYAKTPTIASFYTLAMIFSTIDPSQYESYTLEVLFLALQPFTFDCSITTTVSPGTESYLFRINLNENHMPRIIIGGDRTQSKEGIRYLDIEKFLTKLQSWVEDNKNNSNTLLIEHELELFPAVISCLKSKQAEWEKQRNENRPRPINNQSVNLVFGFGALEGLLIANSMNVGLQLKYITSEWTVQSQSETGCELESHLDLVNDELSLGDLVAMVSGADEGEPDKLLKIAYLSQLQQLDQGVLLAGLEYLEGDANPLTYIKLDEQGETENGAQSNGICLSDENDEDSYPIMIVDRHDFHEDQQYLIKTLSKICTVKAVQLVRVTLRHAFFQYKIIKEESLHKQEASNVINIAS